jgi:hypothetical protein
MKKQNVCDHKSKNGFVAVQKLTTHPPQCGAIEIEKVGSDTDGRSVRQVREKARHQQCKNFVRKEGRKLNRG